jgi:aspartyl-tRNA(Asn)/glutamyl-tRNA(Gln) amidotransferase subunit C
VEEIARLARLDLSATEVEALTRDLGEILGYVERIAALEAGATAPPAASLPRENATPEASPLQGNAVPAATPLRDDVVLPSLPLEEALRPSADHDDEFFRVPPVIDREGGA